MTTEFDKTLSSLAYLATCADNEDDYVGYFEPFLLLAISETKKYTLTAVQAQKDVEASSGFRLPAHVVDLLLRRLVKKGYLLKKDLSYEILSEPPEINELIEKKADFERRTIAVIQKITQHAEHIGLKGWSDDRSRESLYDLVDEFSIPLLNNAVFNIPVKLPEDATNEARYVFATFANKLRSEDPETFDALVKFVKGSMSANAVLYTDPTRVRSKVTDLKIFLDTGFLLSMLGYEGKESGELLLDAAKVAKSSGAKLRVLSHTLDEAAMVLHGVARRLKSPGIYDSPHGRVFHHAREKHIPSSTVMSWATSLKENLARIGVLEEEVDLSKFEPQYSESELERVIQKAVGYQEDSTRHRDLKSIAAVSKFRGSSHYSDIAFCKAIFVTTNTALMQSAISFLNDGDIIRGVPYVISIEILTNLIWLKDPMKGKNIPKYQVLATISAGLSVPDRVWKKYLQEIDRLSQVGRLEAEQIAMLRYSAMAPKELMEITLGRESDVDEETVEALLARIEESIAGDYAYRYRQLENSIKGPRERLESLISFIAWVPSAILIGLIAWLTFASTLLFNANLAISILLSVIPTAAFYLAFSRKLARVIRRKLEILYIGIE